LIALDKVSKNYGKNTSTFTALDKVSFEVTDGATVAIIGKSGSGKSTLMHVMSGLDSPSSGSVIIDGQPLQSLSQKKIDAFRANDMGFIFQSFFIEPNQTCLQNVLLPLEIAKVARGSRKPKALEALTAVGLDDKADNLAVSLSGGQKQRLAIARAVANKPRILFADEPTGNLDSATGEMIIKLLFSLNADLGCTLIVVTHDKDLALRCQKQIQIKDGKVQRIDQANQRTKKVVR